MCSFEGVDAGGRAGGGEADTEQAERKRCGRGKAERQGKQSQRSGSEAGARAKAKQERSGSKARAKVEAKQAHVPYVSFFRHRMAKYTSPGEDMSSKEA